MAKHEPFRFKTGETLLKKATELGLEIPWQTDIGPLFQSLFIGEKKIPNRLAVHPMEGFDANPDGSPGEHTFRRYNRYAEGGSGLIWFEATSILKNGRSNPRQLLLNKRSFPEFQRLVETIRKTAIRTFGESHSLYLVLQLTHSGRFSKPEGKPAPSVIYKNPYLDAGKKGIKVVNDEDLEKLKESFIEAGILAEKAGFDSVDVKASHGYLLHEFLSSFTREESRYGGKSFENRIRFGQEVMRGIRKATKEIHISSRINLYDALPYPYGFGVNPDDSETMNLAEPTDLVHRYVKLGCRLINGTMGIPYLHPHINRPFDTPLHGSDVPGEHPLEGVTRLIQGVGSVQKAVPEAILVGTGYSWLREFIPYVGAAVLDKGMASVIGIGRGSFAYPDAPRDLMLHGKMDRKKVCITCSRCTELMRNSLTTGCAVRDKEIYGKLYNKMMS